MPNWCYTCYKVFGDKEQINKLYSAIKEMDEQETPRIENGFGNLWLGCLVDYFGGNYEDIKCRGEITEYEMQEDVLRICTETAWCELNEVRKFLENVLPGIKIYYISEEPGMEEYYTNDSTYEIFHTKYFLDTCDLDFDSEEFANEKELVAFLNSKGIKCHDEESAMKAVKEYADDIEDEDKYISLYKYQIED